jgi:hypothetical protein
MLPNRMVFKVRPVLIGVSVLVVFALGYWIGTKRSVSIEKFTDGGSACLACRRTPCKCANMCHQCKRPAPCGCTSGAGSNMSPDGLPYAPQERCPPCPSCPQPDLSKWIKKSSVPPCPPVPDMSRYMLKTECPPLPDMSKYVLKSSVPKCPPCISTCSKPCKIGECPPCPRPRCPVVKCPDPKACPACPAAQCAPCPEPAIQCKANYNSNTPVRPMLASTSAYGL